MKTWTKQEIKLNIAMNDAWVIRGMLAIYACQTASEQNSGETQEDNGIGFNGVDAFILSSFCEQYKVRKSLSPKQMEMARKKMMKYSNQLAKIANNNV